MAEAKFEPLEMQCCPKMTLGEMSHVIIAAAEGRPLQRKSRWFSTIDALATPLAPDGASLIEWHGVTGDTRHFNFADYVYRVRP